MGKTLLDVKILYDKMGHAEKKIADFILEHPTGLVPLSITELADKCGCGEATIVRFARRLGFNGYQQLKISLVQEENVPTATDCIKEGDSLEEVYNKVASDVYCSLEKTKKVLDYSALREVGKKILSAKTIYIMGSGSSASIAIDASHKFLRLGINATAVTDSHMQAITSAHADKDSVIIGISHSGSSINIVEALELGRKNGATTIAITSYGKSPIDKVSDYILHTISDEINYSILGLNSRIAQLTIIDTLYYYLLKHLPNAKLLTNKTENALLDKKF